MDKHKDVIVDCDESDCGRPVGLSIDTYKSTNMIERHVTTVSCPYCGHDIALRIMPLDAEDEARTFRIGEEIGDLRRRMVELESMMTTVKSRMAMCEARIDQLNERV